MQEEEKTNHGVLNSCTHINKLINRKEEVEERIQLITSQLPINILKESKLSSAKKELMQSLEELQAEFTDITQKLLKLGLFKTADSNSTITANPTKEEENDLSSLDILEEKGTENPNSRHIA